MRTSRISQETAQLHAATATPITRRSTRSLSRFAHSPGPNGVKSEVVDIEDVVPAARKRKRASTVAEAESSNGGESKTKAKERQPARRIKNAVTGEETVEPPSNWAEMYNLVMAMRTDPNSPAFNAAVDTMGCAQLANPKDSPRDQRFQTLVSLMLSSQTKDTVTSAAVRKMQADFPAAPGGKKGLSLENVLAADAEVLHSFIMSVGFHSKKRDYIKKAAEILRDQHHGDIPDTIEGLTALPGVGPKMAYLCMSAAWGRHEGIGVDVHVHRITNLWGWNGRSDTKNPEETRKMLESWLPHDKWHEINWLLVGFGQSICLPVGRRCGECEVGLRGLCRSADRAKVNAGRARREMERDVEAVAEKVEHETKMKLEVMTDDKMDVEADVKADMEADVKTDIKMDLKMETVEDETKPKIEHDERLEREDIKSEHIKTETSLKTEVKDQVKDEVKEVKEHVKIKKEED